MRDTPRRLTAFLGDGGETFGANGRGIVAIVAEVAVS